MQTKQVISTIRWIESALSESVKETIFSWQGISRILPDDTDKHYHFVSATHNLAMASTIIAANPNAVQVLTAFGLSIILTSEYCSRLSLMIADESARDELRSTMAPVIEAWRQMINTASPLEILTMPDELRDKKQAPNILTLEIRYRENQNPTLSDLTETTTLLQKLYAAVAEVYDEKEAGPLSVIKVDSGSVISIDCKGLGEIVKHTKEFVIEVWSKARHKRAEELMTKNEAVASSLAIFERISEMQTDNKLDPEAASRLRESLLSSVLGLFKRGALLSEIPAAETVNNEKLLAAFAPRLLEAPKEAKPVKPRKKKSVKRGSAPKKRKKK